MRITTTTTIITARRLLGTLAASLLLVGISPAPVKAVNERGDWPWNLKLHGWHDREIAEDLGTGWFLNVGPTGLRARITHEHPAYFTIKYVFRDSPAHELIEIGDIVVGANGTRLTVPHTFGRGSRGRAGWDGPMSDMAKLIEDSQAADGKLDLIVWPGGDETAEKVVTLQIEPIGRFSPTWPFDCERSDKLMIELCDFLAAEYQRAGRFENRTHTHSAAVLALLASGESKYDRLIQQIMAGYGSKRYDPIDGNGFPAWNWGHDGIVMGEYYLLTRDRSLLPAIESLVTCLMEAQDAESDGYSHKPFPFIRRRMAEGGPKGYGAMSMTGGFAMVALSLFKEAGLEHGGATYDRLHQAFLRSVQPNGSIGYGFQGVDHAVIELTGDDAGQPGSPQGIGYPIPGDMEGISDYAIRWPTTADPRYRPTDWIEDERASNRVYDHGGATRLVVRSSITPAPTQPFEHNGQGCDHHGRSGLGALAHSIGNAGNQPFGYLADHMATGCAKSPDNLMDGHASTHMHVLWGSLGAALADPADFRDYMEGIRWWFIMAHTHDGGFVVMPGRDYASTDHVYGTRNFPTASAALILALKERRLQITGAARNPSAGTGTATAPATATPAAGPRQARSLPADRLAALDTSLLTVLGELSRGNQLESLTMNLSIATTRVWLAAVGPDQTLNFRGAGDGAAASFQLAELSPADRALLARLAARLRPDDDQAQARAGIYLELSGDTATADAYYQRAGAHWRHLLHQLFEG